MMASSRDANCLSFARLRGVARNMKSKSMVVTGAPCSAAAALPMRMASKPTTSRAAATAVNNGVAFTFQLKCSRSRLERARHSAGDKLRQGQQVLSSHPKVSAYAEAVLLSSGRRHELGTTDSR